MKKRVIVKNPSKIEQADIVIGIPSLNEADNISFAVEQIDKGLEIREQAQRFWDLRSYLLRKYENNKKKY